MTPTLVTSLVVQDDPRSLLAQLTAELDEVESCIRRMDDGTYGRCESCGQQVPTSYLQGAPTARRCPNCS
ncbi:MAG: TraR/DksA C4-type zinc finger protein [Acidimicrobiales bacterium]